MNDPRKYKEIVKLADMLTSAGVPFEMRRCYDGWQLLYHARGQRHPVSVIEHEFSFGGSCDRLELAGLLTPAERKADSIVGYMTAREVFDRIRKHWAGRENDGKTRAAAVSGVETGAGAH